MPGWQKVRASFGRAAIVFLHHRGPIRCPLDQGLVSQVSPWVHTPEAAVQIRQRGVHNVPDCVKSRTESNLAGEKPGIWAVSGLSSIR